MCVFVSDQSQASRKMTKRKRMEGSDRNTERMTANLTRRGTKLFEQEGRTSATRIENTKTGEKVNKNQKIKRHGADSVDQGFPNPLTQNRSAIKRKIREFQSIFVKLFKHCKDIRKSVIPLQGKEAKCQN